MFSGIVQQIGQIKTIHQREQGKEFTISSTLPMSALALGASVAHSGVCLTVTEAQDKGNERWHKVYLLSETLKRTYFDSLEEGDNVNLEPALRLGDSLDGHLVFGHVDACAEILALEPIGESWLLRVKISEELASFFAFKGSVCVDGLSLTITKAQRDYFECALIPHSYQATCMQFKRAGDFVNIEVDMLARYVKRQIELSANSSN